MGYIKGRFPSLRELQEQIDNAVDHERALAWVNLPTTWAVEEGEDWESEAAVLLGISQAIPQQFSLMQKTARSAHAYASWICWQNSSGPEPQCSANLIVSV